MPYVPDVLQKLDARSDVSGETTASDSGRGGSEEEAKNSINNNIKGARNPDNQISFSPTQKINRGISQRNT